jgi:SAM-dependent methyltransferase
MYQGGSKDNGVVVGKIGGGAPLELNDAQEMVSAEESMMGFDEDGKQVAISSQIDPSSGELCWVPTFDFDHVKNKTVSMSQMTSMLRDTDRNNLFEIAIQTAINAFVQRYHRRPVVLDIGCGTGLLSLFAARHGAEFVFAVEMFDTMSQIATSVIAENGFSDKVFIINAKSTEIEQLPCEVDIIISELLDSALLGESCIPSHSDAISRFLRKEMKDPSLPSSFDDHPSLMQQQQAVDGLQDRIIPNRAEVFATLIEGIEVKNMNRIDSMVLGREPFNVYRNEAARQCKGGWAPVPIHFEALEYRGAKKLSDSIQCLRVNFANPFLQKVPSDSSMSISDNDSPSSSLPSQFPISPLSSFPVRSYETEIQVKATGIIHGVLLWWKTYLLSDTLDPSLRLAYSTEPGVQNWQDHWQQVIYPLPDPINVNSGDIMLLRVSHDDLSIWVNLQKISSSFGSSNCSDPFTSDNRIVGSKRNREEHRVRSLHGITPRSYNDRIDKKYDCACGWHLLNGCDSFLYSNSFTYNKIWDNLFDHLLDGILDRVTQHILMVSSSLVTRSVSPFFILDISDGSVLSLTFATKLKKKLLSLQQSGVLPPLDRDSYSVVHFISKEKKQFSRIFYSQIIEANSLDNMISLWDGSLEELESIIDSVCNPSNGDDDSDKNVGDDNSLQNERSSASTQSIQIVLNNCFSYQLRSLPLWEAISYYYQLSSLQSFLHPNAVTLPRKALIMALPLELHTLKNCHGLVNRYNYYFVSDSFKLTFFSFFFIVCLDSIIVH